MVVSKGQQQFPDAKPMERLSSARATTGHLVLSRLYVRYRAAARESASLSSRNNNNNSVIVVARVLRVFTTTTAAERITVIALLRIIEGHRSDALRHGFRRPKRPSVAIIVHPPTTTAGASPYGLITSVAANLINETPASHRTIVAVHFHNNIITSGS